MVRPLARIGWLAFPLALVVAPRSFGQSSASFPEPEPAPSATTPAPTAPTPAPAPAPAPTTAPPPPPTYPPPPAQEQPPPAYQQPPPAAYGPPPPYEPLPPPPPPERPKDEGFRMPPLSVRVDPFMWLLDGKLGFELEAGLVKFVSLELVPIFVVNEQPPTFGYFSGRDDGISRASAGWGPLAGTSVDLGFWLEGKPLRGSVLRLIFTNYAYEYTSRIGGQEVDQFTHVERQLLGYFGSHSRWGAFTLAGGLGLGAELNNEERCYNRPATDAKPTKGCGRMDLKLDPSARTVVDLSGGLGGVQILVRISFGVTFD